MGYFSNKQTKKRIWVQLSGIFGKGKLKSERNERK
jgi:hypothetical protein